MRQFKLLALCAIAAMALTAFLGVGTAGASNLRIFGSSANLAVGTVIEASLEKETSTFFEDAFGFTAATCTGSSLAGTLSRTTQGFQSPDTSAGQPKGSLSALSFTPCPHSFVVEGKGELEIRNISGTTNGTIFSSNMRVEFFSTLLAQSCTTNTGSGTDIGTLTGASSASSKATMDLSQLVPLQGCSAANARWTGKYEVSKPLGLVSEA